MAFTVSTQPSTQEQVVSPPICDPVFDLHDAMRASETTLRELMEPTDFTSWKLNELQGFARTVSSCLRDLGKIVPSLGDRMGALKSVPESEEMLLEYVSALDNIFVEFWNNNRDPAVNSFPPWFYYGVLMAYELYESF